MSGDPWGTETDLFSGGEVPESAGAGSSDPQRRLRSPAVLFGIAAAVLALIAVVASLAGAQGYGTVGVAAAGYLLAVMADVATRRFRYDSRNYRRPKAMLVLRFATFAAAVGVAWLAASSLVGA
ncbi:hypothetical protein [Candidatus Poriferisocius sp.]|uniref:hypothetical protein n=1 Tax=Candidatus Poriferisocius sp. TaxID=3101276 RepID=UPI003B015CDC